MKLYIYLFAIITILIANTGCNKNYLDKLPLDSPSNANFFSSQDELQLAINGAYTNLWWMGANNVPYQMYLDAATDIAWSRGDYANVQTVQSGQFNSQASIFSNAWSQMYNGISKCNNILENMNRAQHVVSVTFYNQIKAQALFLRSYYYFYLVELYGNVPWVTTILSLDSANLSSTPKAQILQSLYKDLDTAAAYLPVNWGGSDAGRATKGAALTLKARLALCESDYSTAATAADSVINLNIYSIDPNYEQLFQYAGENSNEIILNLPFLTGTKVNGIPQIEGPRFAPGYSILVPRQTLVDMYECADGLPIDKSPLYNPLHPFANRDPRLDQSIIRPGAWFDNHQFETNPDSTRSLAVVGGDTVYVGNLEVTNPYATFTGYLWRKYLDPSDIPQNVTSSQQDFILMRYAEVLLTYAEAKIELNKIDQSVIDAINQVRGRASVHMPLVHIGMAQDSLRKIVRYERTVEFADEGFRLFDIRRWKIGEDVMPGNVYGRRQAAYWTTPVIPAIDQNGHPTYANGNQIFKIIGVNTFDPSKNYLWPIPQTELDVDHNLKQNPGY